MLQKHGRENACNVVFCLPGCERLDRCCVALCKVKRPIGDRAERVDLQLICIRRLFLYNFLCVISW